MAITIDISKIDRELDRVWNSPEDLRAYHNDLKAEAKRLTDATEKDLKTVNAGAKVSTQMTDRLHELQRASDAVDYVQKKIDDAGPVGDPVDHDGGFGNGGAGWGGNPAWYDKGGGYRNYVPVPGRAKYRDLFGDAAGDSGGFQSFDELTGAIARRDFTRLQGQYDSRAMVGSVPSEGGFVIGETFSAKLLDAALENEVVRARASIYPVISGNLIKIPGFEVGTHVSSQTSGVTAAWGDEDSQFSAQSFNFRLVQLQMNKIAVFAQSSSELLEDADVPTFGRDLEDAIARAIRFKLDGDFLNGDGSGKPQGVLNADCTVAVTAASSGGIEYADLTGMFSRLHPASYARSVWVAHPSTIPKLAALTVSGTNDSGWVNVMTNRTADFVILTRPVIFTEKVPALGSNGALLLADFSQYGIGIKRDVRLISTNAVNFDRDRISWLCSMRCDGQALWNEALTPQNGSTLSPFVKLNDS